MARGRLFYGWWVTIAFAVMIILSTGVRFSVGPFLKPMIADLQTDRASFSLVVALSLLLYGVLVALGLSATGHVVGSGSPRGSSSCPSPSSWSGSRRSRWGSRPTA